MAVFYTSLFFVFCSSHTGCPVAVVVESPAEDMQHGWSCRGDLSVPEVKRDVEPGFFLFDRWLFK